MSVTSVTRHSEIKTLYINILIEYTIEFDFCLFILKYAAYMHTSKHNTFWFRAS